MKRWLQPETCWDFTKNHMTCTLGKLYGANRLILACSVSQRKSLVNKRGGKVHNNYRFYICNFTPEENVAMACKDGGISKMVGKRKTDRAISLEIFRSRMLGLRVACYLVSTPIIIPIQVMCHCVWDPHPHTHSQLYSSINGVSSSLTSHLRVFDVSYQYRHTSHYLSCPY